MKDKSAKFKVVTLREFPGLNEIFSLQKERIWPEFMFHDLHAAELWRYTWQVFDEFQIYLLWFNEFLDAQMGARDDYGDWYDYYYGQSKDDGE